MRLCAICDEQIAPKRLLALPDVRTCIRCADYGFRPLALVECVDGRELILPAEPIAGADWDKVA